MAKVLMVGPVPPPFGGIASVIQDIVESDLKKDYAFEIFQGTFPYPARPVGKFGTTLVRLRHYATFAGRVLRGGYDLVHIQASGSAFFRNAVFCLIARILGRRVLFHLHGTDWDRFYVDAGTMKQRLVRWTFRLPNAIIVLYSKWADEIRSLPGSAPVTVVRNFVHDAEPPAESATNDIRERLGIDPSAFVVLMVGSVGWRKGVFDILKAVPTMVREAPDITVVLAGGEEDPGEMQQIRSIVASENLGSHVRVLGEITRTEVPALLSTADLFLLPSYIEGMPISIIEALRSRVPVVSTTVGGIPDMMDHGISGILIEPGNPDLIAGEVLRLRNDDELRLSIGAAGRRAFETRFEFSQGIDEIRAVYCSLGL